MQELVYFLIEERYCNSELEAIKILESVSDEFYDYLIEKNYDVNRFAPERVGLIRRRIEKLKSKAQNNPTSVQDPEKLRRDIKFLKGALRGPIDNQIEKANQEMKRRIDAEEATVNKGSLPTPRGPGGSGAQKPRDVISTVGTIPGVQKTNQRKYSIAATRLTGISPESGSLSSVSSPQTGEMVAGSFDREVSGGRGTGTTRTGGKTPRAR